MDIDRTTLVINLEDKVKQRIALSFLELLMIKHGFNKPLGCLQLVELELILTKEKDALVEAQDIDADSNAKRWVDFINNITEPFTQELTTKYNVNE